VLEIRAGFAMVISNAHTHNHMNFVVCLFIFHFMNPLSYVEG